jgi:hypothetical protein
MEMSLNHHVENLKNVLLKLSPTGESGFEGLIGVALREITGVPFRLAGSGSQAAARNLELMVNQLMTLMLFASKESVIKGKYLETKFFQKSQIFLSMTMQ